MPSPRLTDYAGCAEYIGRTRGAVEHMDRRRQIPDVKVNGRVMFDLRKLDRWIEANTVEAKP